MNLRVKGKCFLVVGLILVLFSAGAEALPSSSTGPAATAPSSTSHHGDPDIQQKRLAFIKNAKAFGWITSIEDTGPVTRVRVGQKFLALSAGEKEDIINAVWAYYKTADPKKNVVRLIDQKSGKEIGEYSPARGGLKMR